MKWAEVGKKRRNPRNAQEREVAILVAVLADKPLPREDMLEEDVADLWDAEEDVRDSEQVVVGIRAGHTAAADSLGKLK